MASWHHGAGIVLPMDVLLPLSQFSFFSFSRAFAMIVICQHAVLKAGQFAFEPSASA